MIRTVIRDLTTTRRKPNNCNIDQYVIRFQLWSVASQFLYLYEEVSAPPPSQLFIFIDF